MHSVHLSEPWYSCLQSTFSSISFPWKSHSFISTYGWMDSISFVQVFIIYSSTDGHQGWLLPCYYEKSYGKHECKYFCRPQSSLSTCKEWYGVGSHREINVQCFRWLPLWSTGAVSVYTPSNSEGGCLSPTSSPDFVLICFLMIYKLCYRNSYF